MFTRINGRNDRCCGSLPFSGVPNTTSFGASFGRTLRLRGSKLSNTTTNGPTRTLTISGPVSVPTVGGTRHNRACRNGVLNFRNGRMVRTIDSKRGAVRVTRRHTTLDDTGTKVLRTKGSLSVHCPFTKMNVIRRHRLRRRQGRRSRRPGNFNNGNF